MKIVTIISFAIITVIATSSCRKITNGVETGTYKGTFTVYFADTSLTGTTEIDLKRKKYSCKGNNNKIPAGGSGEYEIEKKIIRFSDENIWTADFDGNLILNGEYEYNSKGKELLLTKANNGIIYEYTLKR